MKEWTLEERYKKLENPEDLIELYKEVNESKYRQKFHISPLTGLLNDPNGFTYYDGKWHLFYQWFPWGPVHGIKYWYHVTSEDLLHWENQGIALKPDTAYDDFGVHSGSSIIDNGRLYLCFTANHRDEDWNRTASVMLAELDDGKFKKQDLPLFGPREGYSENQRDPSIFYDKNRNKYFIFIGAQNNENNPSILVYSSENIENGWEFEGELKVDGYENFGEMWECPNYKNIDGTDVLIFSPQYLKIPNRADMIHHNVYLTGELDLDNLRFKPNESIRPLDYGFDFYASQVSSNSNDDKNYLIAWSGLPNNAAVEGEIFEGSLTLPRELSVKNNKLFQQPVKGIESLRKEALKDNGILEVPSEMLIEDINGSFELRLFTNKDKSGGLLFKFDSKKKEVIFDRSELEVTYNPENGFVTKLEDVNKIDNLRIFIDSSTIEIFVNDGEYSFTSRVFPSDNETYYKFDGKGYIRLFRLNNTVDLSFKF